MEKSKLTYKQIKVMKPEEMTIDDVIAVNEWTVRNNMKTARILIITAVLQVISIIINFILNK